METEVEAHAPASTLPNSSGLEAVQADCCGDREASTCRGEGASSVSGRDRWVKGAPDRPTNSSDDSGDGDSDSGFANGNERCTGSGCDGGGGGGGDGGGGCGVDAATSACGNMVAGGGGSACVGNKLSSSSSAASAAVAAGAAAGAAASDGSAGGAEGDDGMAWLETGPGNGSGGGSGGSAKGSSKKKKKSKAKGKGGGKTKKLCPGKGTPSSNDLLTAGREKGGATAAGAAGGVSAETDASASSKAAAKRARRNKQRKALNVTFGCVRLLEFTRDVGGCGVPGDGTWGLALGLPFRETSVEVDGYEASKTEVSRKCLFFFSYLI